MALSYRANLTSHINFHILRMMDFCLREFSLLLTPRNPDSISALGPRPVSAPIFQDRPVVVKLF